MHRQQIYLLVLHGIAEGRNIIDPESVVELLSLHLNFFLDLGNAKRRDVSPNTCERR